MAVIIGFIGFGEAAFNIAKGLMGEGLTNIHAYDKYWNIEPQSELVKKRAMEANVTLAVSVQNLIDQVDIVISAVSANLVVPIARESAAFLRKDQIYVDVNSAAPTTKVEASRLIADRALFVDAAVMGPVPGNGHKVPILASGSGSELFQKTMVPYGMKISVMPGPVGGSSASKMFRSIFMKGFVMLLLETVIASKVTCCKQIITDIVNAGGIYCDQSVVTDGKIVTSRVPADLPDFCREILALLSK